MSSSNVTIKEILPKKERVYDRAVPSAILCKPKLLPLRSVTLEKLEKIQREAQDIIKKEEMLQ
uniref:BBSome-interacting protein 1 n=1 Tax=Octopus bimaculoides TaxID=37653 RepID=A0A0L8FRG5_OCTBM